MGIDTQAVLVVGLSASDLDINEEDFEDKYSSSWRSYSPYYDAPYEDCLIGKHIAKVDRWFTELSNEDITELQAGITKKFKQDFGKDPKLLLSTYIW